tara:strand:- start:173 stop:337 length:165 start_codon:yes stop_codon:yes gene_type:complete
LTRRIDRVSSLLRSATFVGSAESSEDNLFKAIDEAKDKVETQLKRYHDKQVQHR